MRVAIDNNVERVLTNFFQLVLLSRQKCPTIWLCIVTLSVLFQFFRCIVFRIDGNGQELDIGAFERLIDPVEFIVKTAAKARTTSEKETDDVRSPCQISAVERISVLIGQLKPIDVRQVLPRNRLDDHPLWQFVRVGCGRIGIGFGTETTTCTTTTRKKVNRRANHHE